MVKYIMTRGDIMSTNKLFGVEFTRFSREFNTYGVGENLLYPVEMNDSSNGQPQPQTYLAAYLITFQEFQKSNVEVRKNGNKAW